MQKNFIVYKSSAGSGKTFTLVKEYLKIALSEDSDQPQLFKKILAVTFTNKAAAEMKERIISALKNLSNTSTSNELSNILCAELSLANNELSSRARKLLSHILHNYSDFSISTIDSFTHKIIKTFAFDLKLPVNFTVETNTDDFYSKVISALISRVGENPSLTKLLLDYSINNAGNNASWDPEPSLTNFTNALQKEDADSYTRKLKDLDEDKLQLIYKTLREFNNEFRAFVKAQGQKALDLIKQHKLTDEHFHYTKSGPQSFFRKCAAFNFDALEDLIGSRIIDAVENGKWYNKKNSETGVYIPDSLTQELNAIAKGLISYLREHYERYSLYSLVEKNIYAILLVNELQAITNEFKQEEQIVFISEFNSKISKVVADEPAPFIYERLGERYHHFLIDEFQDTSSLQWQNILPLLDNSLASGRFNLIVGDGKQSIYRWRNANVKQFSILPEIPGSVGNSILSEREANLERNYTGQVLDTNYRSLPEIIDFNNDLFDRLPKKYLNTELQKIYHSQAQAKKNTSGGYVSISIGQQEKDDLEQRNFDEVSENISHALSSGFSFRDICIIVRGNDKGNAIANFLIDKKIPVISSESLLLKNAPEVNCIVSFLAVIADPSDKINSAAVLTYILNEPEYNNHDLATSLKKLSVSELFEILSKIGINISGDSLAKKNILDIGMDIVQKLDLNKKNPQYVRFFLDEVNDYLVNRSGSVNDFINWWEKRREKASVIIPEGTNAVRIMTIHKSKGLEFPVVIVPFANWEVLKTGHSWVDINDNELGLPVALLNLNKSINTAGLGSVYEKEKDEQVLDNLNLLYVAFTRAVERLHIIAYKSKTQRKETVSDWISTVLPELKLTEKNGKFETGTASLKISKEKLSEHTVFDISELDFNTNTNLISIKGSHKLKIEEQTERAREKGIKMHYILSEIYSSKDVQPVLDKMIKKGLIAHDEKAELDLKINELLSNVLLKEYFQPDVSIKNEVEMITEAGEILRPDRIVIDKKTAIVIDYKTGKPNDKYARQMNKYQDALNKMGFQSVKKLLVYVEENEVSVL